MKYQIEYIPFFERKLKKLEKKYPHIKKDVLPLIKELEKGIIVGDSIPGFKNKVYKARISSRDQQKGKSGGYRIIYYLKTSQCKIFFITIYAKAFQENISTTELNQILQENPILFI